MQLGTVLHKPLFFFFPRHLGFTPLYPFLPTCESATHVFNISLTYLLVFHQSCSSPGLYPVLGAYLLSAFRGLSSLAPFHTNHKLSVYARQLFSPSTLVWPPHFLPRCVFLKSREQVRPPCYYLPRLCNNANFSCTVDEELAAKFDSELSLELMEYQDEMPLGLKEFLDNSLFEVICSYQTRLSGPFEVLTGAP